MILLVLGAEFDVRLWTLKSISSCPVSVSIVGPKEAFFCGGHGA